MERERHVNCSAQSLKGLEHDKNEDAFGVFRDLGLYIVADGVGGYRGGEVASQLAVRVVVDVVSQARDRSVDSGEVLRRAFIAANTSILSTAEQSQETPRMATTALALLFEGDAVHIAHVGDSRAYHWRADAETRRLTRDHSPMQRLLDAGLITEKQAMADPLSRVIDRALGLAASVAIDLERLTRCRGDRFLLCSDGLTRVVLDREIDEALRTPGGAEAQATHLVALAQDRGTPDDVTVVVVHDI